MVKGVGGMTFVCLECGEIFDKPIEWEETHRLDTPPYEKFSGCPYCGGAYTEAPICDCCGEWITDDYIKVDDKRFCNNCFVHYDLREED